MIFSSLVSVYQVLLSTFYEHSFMLQKEDSQSGCDDSQYFIISLSLTVLAHSTPNSAPSYLQRFPIYRDRIL